EPTTGLHMADVAGLIGLLDRMVNNGSTVIVIEHNLDVVARADWVLDMGPGAGNEGGRIVFEGVPAMLAENAASLSRQHVAERVGRTFAKDERLECRAASQALSNERLPG